MRITKQCGRCKLKKPYTEFSHRANTGKPQPWCRACNTEYQRQRYKVSITGEKHRKTVRARKKKHLQRIRKFLVEYLETHPCVVCGESDRRVLEFDHIDRSQKFRAISHMVNAGFGLTKLQAEIAKCQVLCANCHRRKTAIEFEWYK